MNILLGKKSMEFVMFKNNPKKTQLPQIFWQNKWAVCRQKYNHRLFTYLCSADEAGGLFTRCHIQHRNKGRKK